MIKASTIVALIRSDGVEVWRGSLVDYFTTHSISAPRSVLAVCGDLTEKGKADHGGLGMFTVKLVGESK